MAAEPRITLSQLQARIAGALADAVPLPVWVSAEVAEMKVNASGHCYLELVEKDEKSSPNGVAQAQARGVIWRSAWPSIAARFERESGSRLGAGMKILVKATVNYHPLYGLSLQITDIDPTYTLGDMERQKQRTIAQLQADGVWDMNRELPLPPVVQRVAVISSASAAGYRDFMRELAASAYRIETRLFEAVMQGATSEQSVIDALVRVAEEEERFDAVAIIRGGGSTGDLACFNSYMLASYVAQSPLPVLTGIGHDKDVSVADMVAGTMLKTPTAVAAWLCNRMAEADAALADAAIRLREACRQTAHGAEIRLQTLFEGIKGAANTALATGKTRLQHQTESLRTLPATAIRDEERRLDALAMVAENYSPKRLLQLGYGIARTADNRILRSVEGVKAGETVTVTLADGELESEIKEIKHYGTERY